MQNHKHTKAWPMQVCMFCLLLQSVTVFCQSTADVKTVEGFSAKFRRHALDFIEFEQASQAAGNEFEITMSFVNLCEEWQRESNFISEELYILAILETKTDREKVKKVLKTRIQTAIKRINESGFKEINLGIGSTKQPSIVAQGNKLKDDLKDFQKALQVIKDKEDVRSDAAIESSQQ